jgi:hypothetical protein
LSLLKKLDSKKKKILGICFGHQVFNYWFSYLFLPLFFLISHSWYFFLRPYSFMPL